MAFESGNSPAKYAFLPAAALLAVGVGLTPASTPARAADLGGNCCADLEERVAELEATSARKGNRKVSLTITGQVTTALMAWDNGKDSDVYVVDPPTVGGSYFAFTGDAKINPNLTAGFNITIGLDTGARSHQVSEKDDDGQANIGSASSAQQALNSGGYDSFVVLTLANWYLDHKQLGRVTVGRINTATAGATGVDLGGASVIANVNIGYWQRSFTAIGSKVNGSTAATSWSALMGGGPLNGSTLSRANAISYTTPTFGGFSVSTAWGEDDVWDAAVRYAGEHAGFRMAAAIGYANNASGLGDVTETLAGSEVTNAGFAQGAKIGQWKGSASVLHVATGLYLTGAYINQDNDAGSDVKNTTLWYLNGGIAKNWTGLGNTVLYGEYSQVRDAAIFQGNDITTYTRGNTDVWGLGVVQNIDAAALELFLSYRNYSADTNVEGSNIKDFDVVMGGARIRF
jgi:hypothetical protein